MKFMNILLTLLLLISVFIVIKFSKLTLPSFFPEFLVQILECPEEGTNAYELIRILEKVSLAIITALIIFFLINYIPRKRAERKALAISERSLTDIYLNMSKIIGPINMMLEITKENKKIHIKDLSKLNDNSNKTEKIYFKEDIYLSDIGHNGFSKGIYFYPNDLPPTAEKVVKLIDDLIALPSSSNLPVKLLENLSSIRSSRFLEICNDFKNPISESNNVTIYKFDKAYHDFLKLYLQIENYNFRKISYKYSKLNDEDIKKLVAEKREVFKTLKSTITRSNYTFYKNSIRYRVSNGKLIE